ncbi:MAG: sugar phosphate isomerase/epimerase family protein [bacterium]
MPGDERLRRRLGIQILFDFSDIIDAIEFVASAGLAVVEINLGNLRFREQLNRIQERKKIRNRAEDLDVKMAIHALEGPSFFIPSRRVRRCAVAELKQTLNWAWDIGAQDVVMHLGFDMHYGMGPGGNRYTHEEFPEYYDDALYEALGELKEFARGKAVLCVENVGGFRYEPAKRILPGLLGGSLGLCFDIGHIAILPKEKREEEFEFFRQHQRAIFHSHIHHNHGTRDEHLPLGQGSADVRRYLQLVVDSDAWLVMETRPKEFALTSIAYFQRILPGLK